jgi:uncharacterized protein YegP (UPF0339 family)
VSGACIKDNFGWRLIASPVVATGPRGDRGRLFELSVQALSVDQTRLVMALNRPRGASPEAEEIDSDERDQEEEDEEVSKLKQQYNKDVAVHGSRQLAPSLLDLPGRRAPVDDLPGRDRRRQAPLRRPSTTKTTRKRKSPNPIAPMTLGGSGPVKIIVYPGKSSDYRWKLKAENGEIIADSAEGYRRKRYATRRAKKVAPNAELVIED